VTRRKRDRQGDACVAAGFSRVTKPLGRCNELACYFNSLEICTVETLIKCLFDN
jgi:hypothetical protein